MVVSSYIVQSDKNSVSAQLEILLRFIIPGNVIGETHKQFIGKNKTMKTLKHYSTNVNQKAVACSNIPVNNCVNLKRDLLQYSLQAFSFFIASVGCSLVFSKWVIYPQFCLRLFKNLVSLNALSSVNSSYTCKVKHLTVRKIYQLSVVQQQPVAYFEHQPL